MELAQECVVPAHDLRRDVSEAVVVCEGRRG